MEDKTAPQPAKEKQELMQLIVFRVGDEEFGVPIGAVQEIIKVGTITPIPDSPSFIKGLINVRGEIVAIIDVRARFFLTTRPESSRHIVISKYDSNLFGLMVDEVMEVLRIQESEIKRAPKLMSKIHEEYVQGVVTHEERLIILLDVSQVLSEEEMIRLAEMNRDQHKDIFQDDVEDHLEISQDENKPQMATKKKKHMHDKGKK